MQIFSLVKRRIWRIRKNKKIRQLYKDPSIVGVVKTKKLRCRVMSKEDKKAHAKVVWRNYTTRKAMNAIE